MWSLAETSEFVTNRLQLGDIRVYIRTILDLSSTVARQDYVEVGYQGPDLRSQMDGDEFCYVRYFDWSFGDDLCQPFEIRRVGKAYADWLVRMGSAAIVTEAVAAREASYIRKFSKRSEPFTQEEAIDHLRENLGWGETGRAQAVIDALADDAITALSNEQKWTEILDLIGLDAFEAGPETIKPAVQLNTAQNCYEFNLSAARTCIGGPLHNKIHDNRFTSFQPHGYQDTDINTEDGSLFMRVWTHASLDTPDKRSAAFGDWYNVIQASLPKEAA